MTSGMEFFYVPMMMLFPEPKAGTHCNYEFGEAMQHI